MSAISPIMDTWHVCDVGAGGKARRAEGNYILYIRVPTYTIKIHCRGSGPKLNLPIGLALEHLGFTF